MAFDHPGHALHAPAPEKPPGGSLMVLFTLAQVMGQPSRLGKPGRDAGKAEGEGLCYGPHGAGMRPALFGNAHDLEQFHRFLGIQHVHAGRQLLQIRVIPWGVHVPEHQRIRAGDHGAWHLRHGPAQPAIPRLFLQHLLRAGRKEGGMPCPAPVRRQEDSARLPGAGVQERLQGHFPDQGDVGRLHEKMAARLRKPGDPRAHAGKHALFRPGIERERSACGKGFLPDLLRPAAADDNGMDAHLEIAGAQCGKRASRAACKRQWQQGLEQRRHAA